MNIIIIQSIFIFDIIQEKRWIDSLISLDNFLENNNIEIELYIIGYNNISKENILVNFKHIKKYIKLLLFTDKNYGKSYNVNYILNTINENQDFLFYMDGDIILLKYENLFDKLIDISKHNFGIIALNQQQDCRHNPMIYLHQIQIENITLLHSDSEYGIAGGVYFMKFELAKKYRLKEVGIYGPDDTLLIKELRKDGYVSVVVKDIYVIHPFENNENYKKNKNEIISQYFLNNEV